MKRIFYDNTPTVAVVAGSNAFGSVTSVYTTKIPWEGFKLSINGDITGSSIWVQLYLNGVSWGPTWLGDASRSILYDIPLRIPQGVAISASAYYSSSGTPTVNLTLFGKSEGSDILSSIVNLSAVGAFINLSTANTWIQLGSALPSVPIRKVLGEADVTNATVSTYDLGFGPSSTSVTPIITGINVGSEYTNYVFNDFSFKTFFNGSGNYLWGQSPNTTARLWVNYGY